MAGKALRKAMVQTASWAKEQERAGQQWPYCVLLMVSATALDLLQTSNLGRTTAKRKVL